MSAKFRCIGITKAVDIPHMDRSTSRANIMVVDGMMAPMIVRLNFSHLDTRAVSSLLH
jgi:hypothetical protein